MSHPSYARVGSAGTLVLCLWILLSGGAAVAQQGTVDFLPAVEYAQVGPGAGNRIVAGDVDLDCDLDLFNLRDTTATSENPSLNELTGEGPGGFSLVNGINAGQVLSGLQLADVNHDGFLDLVTSELFDTQVGPFGICGNINPMIPILLGNGLGGFALERCLQPMDHPSDVVVGDFYKDGNPDILVINAVSASGGATSPAAVLYVGFGNGTFLDPRWVFDRKGDDVEAADFNLDGYLDVVVAGRSASYVYLGSATGSFSPVGAGIGGQSRRVAAADVNGDGAPDIVAVGSAEQSSADDLVTVALNRNDGSGTFLPAVTYTTGLHPIAVAAADLDLDGRDDVIVANHWSDDVSVYLSNPDGTLAAEQRFPANRDPIAVLVEDFNLDGFPDIVVANRNVVGTGGLDDGSVSVLIQSATAPLEVVTPRLPGGEVGVAYHACNQARGGQPEYQWSVVSGSLPPGLILDPATGRYHGTPAVAGISDFTCQVEDGAASTASALQRITVNDAPGQAPSSASDPMAGMAPMIVTDFNPLTGMVTIQYDPACRSSDSAIHTGPLQDVGIYGYDKTVCGKGVTGTAQFRPGAGDRFWVISGRDGIHDGSLGTASSGAERPGPPDFNSCFLPHEVGAVCP